MANAAYLEWFGFSPQEMSGLHISEVLGAELYLENLSFIRGALRGDEQLFERTIVDQAGRPRHTQASYVPDVEAGEVRGFFALVTDVTPRVEAQRALNEAQTMAKLGSWRMVPATGQVTWTPEMFNIMGIDMGIDPHDQPPWQAMAERIHPDDRDRVFANIDEAIRTGEPYTINYRVVRSDGSERDVVSHGQPVAGADSQILHINGTLQDLTETNQFARELAHNNANLRQVNELNREVIAMLGHDIRSSLGAVRNYLDLLGQDEWPLSADESRVCVSRARLATESLMTLVDHILAEASSGSGALEPVRERVDLYSVIEAAVQVPGLSGTVWVRPQESPVIAVFDRVHLMQILDNLLTNARRYGRQPIRVSLVRDASHVTISVTDAGDGVPAKLAERLFTKFVRTGAEQASSGGAGFGLYMSLKLAEANGGNLSYHPPQHGQAHAFTLTIPMTDDTLTASA